MTKKKNVSKHNMIEDTLSIIQAILIFSVGVHMFQQTSIVAGGTTGLSLLASYFTTYTVGQLLFIINLPFYFIALARVGFLFFAKTLFCVILTSVLIDNMDSLIHIEITNRFFGALLSGLFCGIGILILLRHNASVGGFTILLRYVQDTFNINGGKLLLVLDSIIMLTSYALIDALTFFYSSLALLMVNLILILNNKPGRYSTGK